MRELILAALLAIAAGLVVAGAVAWSVPAGLVVAGIVLALWSWLILGEV